MLDIQHYEFIRGLHVACVWVSGLGFLLRGIWMLMGSKLLQRRLTRILPHIVDTCLLTSAILLAIMLHQSPMHSPWVAAKIVGLCIYIVLGTIALKRGKTYSIRLGAFIAALGVLAWIISVAVAKNPWGFFAALMA